MRSMTARDTRKVSSTRDGVCFRPGVKWLIRKIILVTGPVSYAVALHDGRECRADSNSIIRLCQRGQVDTDTDTAPYTSYRPFSLVLPNKEMEVVASIPVVSMANVTPEKTDLDRDNVVIPDIAVSTPTSELLRVTTPARKTGRWVV